MSTGDTISNKTITSAKMTFPSTPKMTKNNLKSVANSQNPVVKNTRKSNHLHSLIPAIF